MTYLQPICFWSTAKLLSFYTLIELQSHAPHFELPLSHKCSLNRDVEWQLTALPPLGVHYSARPHPLHCSHILVIFFPPPPILLQRLLAFWATVATMSSISLKHLEYMARGKSGVLWFSDSRFCFFLFFLKHPNSLYMLPSIPCLTTFTRKIKPELSFFFLDMILSKILGYPSFLILSF